MKRYAFRRPTTRVVARIKTRHASPNERNDPDDGVQVVIALAHLYVVCHAHLVAGPPDGCDELTRRW